MTLKKYIEDASAKWMEGSGPDSKYVISTRVRLARNLKDIPHPFLAGDNDTEKVVKDVNEAIKRGSAGLGEHKLLWTRDLEPIDRKVLVEKHLISPLLAKEDRNSAIIVREDQAISVMLNEEDHIRIQCLFPGLQLDKAFEYADQIDDLIEESVDYAFDEEWGYLTTCPTNVGTGMRASVMLHLPGLVMTGQINRVLSAVGQVGLAVRGLYGEGTEMVGNIVQLSNQITLGQSEKDILEKLEGVTRQLIDQEEKAREDLLQKGEEKLADKVGRAYGQLSYARIISTNEAMGLLSSVRLGCDMGFLKEVDSKILNDLLVLIRPANLQKMAEKELTSEERDIKRANLIRERINIKKDA
ncbi:protein arginine kinase [Natranaerofaba carboxydovora]|uniref:protein arginine kinase n=1 Tax=Natranaerofaba carboxydovora TaxID=2742683 RepID=UPI001F13A9BA|nr:protein arginine kinase [Natranaerofaba carboxydovora]UMZ75342.1 Protein-arginine kinase [Natranaerofaba carboxydovora]